MKTAKHELLALGVRASDLLGTYVELHNVIMKQTGTFASLFRHIDYPAILKTVQDSLQEWQEFQDEAYTACASTRHMCNTLEIAYIECLQIYIRAVVEAVEALENLQKRATSAADSFKSRWSWGEYSRLRTDYALHVEAYVAKGKGLQKLHNQLVSA